MKSVAGSYRQGNALIFGNNVGYQCTANALEALIFSSLFAVFEWRTHIVDQILLYCDSLFSNVIHDRCQGKKFFDGIKSPSICKLHGAVITHSVSISYDAECLHQ